MWPQMNETTNDQRFGRRIAMIAPFGLRAKGTARARVLPLARQLVQLGHTVAVFIPPYDSPQDAGLSWNDSGVEVVNLALPRGGVAGLSGHLALAQRLYRAVRAWRPDLVHAFKPKGPSGLAAAFLWWSADRCPLVMDSDDWEGPGGWNDDPRTGYSAAQRLFFAWQERFGLAHADAWTVTSACLRRRAVAFGAAPERVFVLHNGIADLEAFAASPAGGEHGPAAATTSGRPAAILYTRFAGVRPEEVVAVWAAVRRARTEAQLMVIGRGVAHEERKLLALPGITVMGWVEPERLPQTLACGQVALVPWDDKPTNRARHSAKVLALMAAGLPIVAYAVGELPATIGDAGVLVPIGDRDAFAREVVALLADPEHRARLAAAVRARVASRFTWPRLSHIALEAYAQAAGVQRSAATTDRSADRQRTL